MNISVQRQCDGIYLEPPLFEGLTNERCRERIELELTTSDLLIDPSMPDGPWLTAWEAAANALGWRRLHGYGKTRLASSTRDVDGTVRHVVIPSTRTWISCRSCTEAMVMTGTDFALSIARSRGFDVEG